MGYTEIASLKLSTIFTSYQETEFLLLNLRTQLELKKLKRAFKNHLSFCLDRIKLFVFLAERSFHSFLSSEIAFLVQVFRTGCEAAGKKNIVFLHRSTESMSKRWSQADWHEVSSSPSPSYIITKKIRHNIGLVSIFHSFLFMGLCDILLDNVCILETTI